MEGNAVRPHEPYRDMVIAQLRQYIKLLRDIARFLDDVVIAMMKQEDLPK